MWDKRDSKDGRPVEFTGSTGYASSAPSPSGRVVNIGQTIFIKGELTGTEDLTVEGRVEGKIELKDHNLTIGPNGKIKADIYAKNIAVTGEVLGNVYASEKVEITNSGVLKGDIISPRIVIADGAQFKGSVDMDKGTSSREKTRDQVKPIATVKDETPASYKTGTASPQVQGNPSEKTR